MATLHAHVIFTDGKEVDWKFYTVLANASRLVSETVDDELHHNHAEGVRVFKVVMTWTPTQ